MDDWRTAFAEEWDVVILGTGMKECLLSGLLSVAGKKVLHLDRNSYYGGASASLDIDQLFEKFKCTGLPSELELGKLRDYAVDMVPKFLMAGGQLVKVLIHTKVANYMEFKPVDGSYVYRGGKEPKIHKVPITPKEALKTSMLSMMEKGRMAQFTSWVAGVKPDDPATWKAGAIKKTQLDLNKMTGAEFFKYWSLEAGTIEFLTHVCALYQDNTYVDKPALEIVQKMQLYLDSMTRFPNMTSPYIYPLYGLGELPQAFARLAAVHGGTYMLNRDLDGEPVFGPDDLQVEYADGAACGVKVKEVMAKSKIIIGDASYFPGKSKKVGGVVRPIALLDEPLPQMAKDSAGSCQVILPAGQVGRTNDLYLFFGGGCHKVAPVNKYVAFLSTKIENEYPEGTSPDAVAAKELSAGLVLLQASKPTKLFYDMYNIMDPLSDGCTDKVFISKSFDPTSHFESAIKDVLEIYERITGAPLEMKEDE